MATPGVKTVNFLSIWKVCPLLLIEHAFIRTNAKNIIDLMCSWVSWGILATYCHSYFVLRNLYWSSLIEKLRSCLIHSKLHDSIVKFILLRTCASNILTILRSNSQPILLDLVVHQLSVEESRISCWRLRLNPTYQLVPRSFIHSIYSHSLSLCLSENAKIVD